MPIELHITDDAGNRRILPVSGAVTVGRGPDCDIVIADPEVSWRHCTLWVEHGIPWIRDHESRNGTFVGDAPVTRATPLSDGSRIRIGSLEAEIRGVATFAAAPASLALFDLGTGLTHPLRSDRFVIGPTGDADLRVEAPPSTLVVHPEGEVWLDDDELPIDAPITLGNLRFEIRRVPEDDARQSTVDASEDRYPYIIAVDLNASTGPTAEIHDPASGAHRLVDATNRAVLLYVLAKRWADDRDADVARARRGWCSDDDLIIGVWGRGALADGAGKLKALLHRLRSELRDAGFDPWFIEKKRGFSRIRVADVRS